MKQIFYPWNYEEGKKKFVSSNFILQTVKITATVCDKVISEDGKDIKL
jgi:hypothetical protein